MTKERKALEEILAIIEGQPIQSTLDAKQLLRQIVAKAKQALYKVETGQ